MERTLFSAHNEAQAEAHGGIVDGVMDMHVRSSESTYKKDIDVRTIESVKKRNLVIRVGVM
ncbi:hypothetical protein SAMN02746089_02143 [Caldanaerobius fijiensis DSM 17918]|uniref:Uncharacterized protein n=1 Tax=Caldanaerobius fijiensis DSM 17918 TaxID=1121256 RepID=A0A1M5CLA1_9THEO|nr:hypothetical protein [Caldanaerobius fijiensis]SHF55456.1 hypothetical protein SAMN02746089_02143 [Caldanaerobius fijiensis DSM 17918]